MAVSDTLPDTLETNTSRDSWATRHMRSYGNRLYANNPQADIAQATAPGSAEWLDAMAIADCLSVLSGQAATIAGTALTANKNEAQLIQEGKDLGVPWPNASGAAGYVLAQTSTNGSLIQPGDVITNKLTRVRYQCAAATTVRYYNGDPVPVLGVDTGPNSNADIGTVLTWDSPRSGCFDSALVKNTNGKGLTGGRDKPSIEEYRAILLDAKANESASGNETAVIRWAQSTLLHGVAVEKAFAYPAIKGFGTMGLTFTVPPDNGGSRIPNGAQMAAVLAFVQSQLPGDDGLLMCSLNPLPVTLIGRVTWGPDAIGWNDYAPWPNYIASDKWVVSASTDASHFTISLDSGVYTTANQPSAGTVFAAFNPEDGKFYKKTVLSFTDTGPWIVTCDTTSGQTDLLYKPVAGLTMVSPWSNSLADIATSLVSYVTKMGPSEQSVGLGDGRKQLRTPRPAAKSFPITINSKVESDVSNLSSVDSFSLVVGLGQTITLGVPGAYSNIFEQPNIAIYSL